MIAHLKFEEHQNEDKCRLALGQVLKESNGLKEVLPKGE